MAFDRYVETIMAAAGNAGYTFHTYWLPWEDEQPSGSSASEPRRKQDADRKLRDRMPGILLFRGPPKPGSPEAAIPLAIFLVPETPTAGVNEAALHTALSIIPGPEIPVAGPCFSGSFWTLKKIFAQYPHHFRVITGSATVTDEWKAFPAQNVSFASTVYDDDYAIGKLFRMIRDEWDSDARVAVISESATRYGQSRRDAKAMKGANSSDDGNAVSALLKYTLTFPREISQLRNAYSEHPEIAATTGNSKVTGPAGSLLPLELRDLRSGNDSVPLFARTQTPISQEAALQNIARALRSRNIEYALLTATDPLDVIFLARYLRNACPDIRLLTLGADVLYARAALENPLSGTLSVTTYPMFPEGWTRLWQSGRTNYIPFPSVESEGIYNATARLLEQSHYTSEPVRLEDYRRPFCADKAGRCAASDAPEQLVWKQNADGGTAPALWLTVLSRTGYWPVGVIGAHGSTLRRALYPTLLYWIVALVLSVLFATLLWRARRRSPDRQDAVLQSAAISAAVAVLIVLAGPFLVNVAPLTALMVSSFSLAAILAVAAPALEAHRVEREARFAIVLLPVSLLVAFSLSYLSLFLPKERLEHIFFSFRSLSLLSGVSPISPLLLLLFAVFWWALAHLARCRSAAEWEKRVHAEALLRCLGLQTDRIQPFLREAFPSTDQWRFGIIYVLAFFTLFTATYTSIRAIEPRPYNELFSATLAFALTASVMAAYRFIRVWLEMRMLLAKLEILPIREVFSTIRGGHSWSLLFSGPRSEFPIDRYVELARRIRNSGEYQRCTAVFRHIVSLMAERRGMRGQGNRDEDNVTLTVQVAKAEVYETVDERGFSLPLKAREEGPETEPPPLVEGDQQLEAATMEFITLPAYEFIVYVLGQMRTMLFFFSGSFVLAAVSLLAYPFSGSGLIANALVTSFLLVGATVTWVLADIDKNPILSRINGTQPGKIGIEFIQAVVVFGLLPLVTVLAAYFPDFGRLLTSFASNAATAYGGER